MTKFNYAVTIDKKTAQIIVVIDGTDFPVTDNVGPVTADFENYDDGVITVDVATVVDGTVDIGFSSNYLWDEVADTIVNAVKSLV